jgi:hypothetical protein
MMMNKEKQPSIITNFSTKIKKENSMSACGVIIKIHPSIIRV